MPVARRLSHGLFREAEENLFGMQAECTGLDACFRARRGCERAEASAPPRYEGAEPSGRGSGAATRQCATQGAQHF